MRKLDGDDDDDVDGDDDGDDDDGDSGDDNDGGDNDCLLLARSAAQSPLEAQT